MIQPCRPPGFDSHGSSQIEEGEIVCVCDSLDQRPTTQLCWSRRGCINVPCRIEVSVSLWHLARHLKRPSLVPTSTLEAPVDSMSRSSGVHVELHQEEGFGTKVQACVNFTGTRTCWEEPRRRGGDDGTQATDALGVPRRNREQSDPGSPEDGQGGQDGQEDDQQEEERSDYASSRAAPGFPGPVEDEQLSGQIDSLRADLVQKVLGGLTGDAYLAAQDLGVGTLMKDGGIKTLIATLKKMICPLQFLEAKELLRVGQMQHGPLSRQTGLSVTSFISRCRRWWRQVKELDSNMLISDQMRSELLIESVGLTKRKQLMIRTASKSHTFDDCAAILLEHHGRIHLKDSRSLAPQ